MKILWTFNFAKIHLEKNKKIMIAFMNYNKKIKNLF